MKMNKGFEVSNKSKRMETFEMSLLGVKYLSEMLRMDKPTILEAVTKLHDEYNLTTKHFAK